MAYRTEDFLPEGYPVDMKRRLAVLGLGLTGLLFGGCSPGPASARAATGDASPPPATQATPAATVKAAPPVTTISVSAPAPGKASPPAASEPAKVTPGQAPTQVALALEPAAPITLPPPPAATTPQPAASRAPIATDIGGLVEVDPAKPGLARIGSDKCKLCHSVQFKSWAATAHAARTPPLDCESCHGAGSEYKTLAIMKDAKKARSAGMVMPVRSFCAKCHTTGWTDDLLRKAHAHKAGA